MCVTTASSKAPTTKQMSEAACTMTISFQSFRRWHNGERTGRSHPMAARANSLTERATKPASDTVHLWSMPAHDVRTFVNGLGRLGYDRDALLASAGLRDSDLTDPDARIPCEALGTILSSRAAHPLHAEPRTRTRADHASRRVSTPRLSRGHVGHGRSGRAAARALPATRWQSGRPRGPGRRRRRDPRRDGQRRRAVQLSSTSPR